MAKVAASEAKSQKLMKLNQKNRDRLARERWTRLEEHWARQRAAWEAENIWQMLERERLKRHG